jgi:hypothetical protein
MYRKITDPWTVSKDAQPEQWSLEETCSELRGFLQAWYKKRTRNHGDIETNELAEQRRKFMEIYPEARVHDFDIWTDFKIVPGSYKPGCFCGDCDVWRRQATARQGRQVGTPTCRGLPCGPAAH